MGAEPGWKTSPASPRELSWEQRLTGGGKASPKVTNLPEMVKGVVDDLEAASSVLGLNDDI